MRRLETVCRTRKTEMQAASSARPVARRLRRSAPADSSARSSCADDQSAAYSLDVHARLHIARDHAGVRAPTRSLALHLDQIEIAPTARLRRQHTLRGSQPTRTTLSALFPVGHPGLSVGSSRWKLSRKLAWHTRARLSRLSSASCAPEPPRRGKRMASQRCYGSQRRRRN
jgi:hypothetical protein